VEALEVAPECWWLRMRLPLRGLNHNHLWALEVEDVWMGRSSIPHADRGYGRPIGTQLLAGPWVCGPGCGRVIYLHPHSSGHTGLAGWVDANSTNCRLLMRAWST